MSTAVLIDYSGIERISQGKISPSSRLDEIAKDIKKLAKAVKQDWENFSDEDREKLKKLAYSIVEPEKSVFSPWNKIRAMIYMLFLHLNNQAEAFQSCIKALHLLVENILDAVERHDSSYKAVLSDTLEQLNFGEQQGKELKPEDTREWLRNLSDSALGEV